jgi:hypothetical protein
VENLGKLAYYHVNKIDQKNSWEQKDKNNSPRFKSCFFQFLKDIFLLLLYFLGWIQIQKVPKNSFENFI